MKRTTILSMAMLLLAIPLAAQSFAGLGVLDDITSAGATAGKKIINVAFVLTGLGAALTLAPAAWKYFKGERESKDALIAVGIGLITAFVILGIIKIVMTF